MPCLLEAITAKQKRFAIDDPNLQIGDLFIVDGELMKIRLKHKDGTYTVRRGLRFHETKEPPCER